MKSMNWKEAIQHWRTLSPGERKRRHLQAIPRHVARSMAMEGEPVDETCLRERLAHLIPPPDPSKPSSTS